MVEVPRSALERCRALVEALQQAEKSGTGRTVSRNGSTPYREVTFRGHDAVRALDDADAGLLVDLDNALQP
jgi:hypothetical protein